MMKNVITFLMCSLCIITGIAQTDLTGNSITIPERTPELETLFQQAKMLDQNGTAAEINANRIAIKNAWQAIDPNVADLYKPIITNGFPETEENLPINGYYYPSVTRERDGEPDFPEDWDTDKLLLDEFVDGGVDMDVTGGGDIYISAFQNEIENGGANFDVIIIFRSTDGGNNFTEWKRVNVTAPMRKLQIITMDGDGDDYLLAYILTSTGNFQVWRWNTATSDFAVQGIVTGVTDFGVDRNFTTSTNGQRVFATYSKLNNETFSARSTAGSYGLDWIDETSLNIFSEQVEFAYGLNGSCYTTYIGFTTRNLRASINLSFNDPTAWAPSEVVLDGLYSETLNPTIRATRLDLANENVIIWASLRAAGTSNEFDGTGIKRINGSWGFFSNFGSGGPDWNIAHTDSWVRRVSGTSIIRTSYIRDNVPDTELDTNRSLTYNGTGFDPLEPVIDAGVRAFDGFPAASAETNDNLPCLAFAGTSSSGEFGFGLYFDAKTVLLNTNENSFENFKFYPNPTNEVLNLSSKNTIENVAIYSILGQKVLEISPNLNNTTINVASLSTGVYVLKLAINGQTATYKFIKQ
jgi:hypothetical protein